jgi:hypothetical protein
VAIAQSNRLDNTAGWLGVTPLLPNVPSCA